ncbi:hypothetical protein I2I05_01390 [Hymenobacter sp. BT683]|uniref:Antitoxin VbhA domain-containing protein n=1 Tax=Hymenobacter jeongseonensis TaxID=2791027 RepID=A0ABS0ICZ4_9BACT|nr:hypothetical protein [Hymenobacter jeongseonensis]MBF9236037.1 hypothetical protein [Hymenobacter jeongseonensis]
MSPQPQLLATEQGRERAVKFALSLTHNTPLAPEHYEQGLLHQFVRGELTIDQVLVKLEQPMSAGPTL